MKTYTLEININNDAKYHHITAEKFRIENGAYLFFVNQKLKACYPINSTIISEIKY